MQSLVYCYCKPIQKLWPEPPAGSEESEPNCKTDRNFPCKDESILLSQTIIFIAPKANNNLLYHLEQTSPIEKRLAQAWLHVKRLSPRNLPVYICTIVPEINENRRAFQIQDKPGTKSNRRRKRKKINASVSDFHLIQDSPFDKFVCVVNERPPWNCRTDSWYLFFVPETACIISCLRWIKSLLVSALRETSLQEKGNIRNMYQGK